MKRNMSLAAIAKDLLINKPILIKPDPAMGDSLPAGRFAADSE
jgi:hypothetical protein